MLRAPPSFSFIRSRAAVAAEASPIPARVPHPVCVADKKRVFLYQHHDVMPIHETRGDGSKIKTYLMQSEERIKFHNRKVISKEDEGGDIDDVLRSVPKMRQKLEGSGRRKPNYV